MRKPISARRLLGIDSFAGYRSGITDGRLVIMKTPDISGQSKLGLGGHSYIEPLGNDPQPSFEEQCAIVSTCIDSGIPLFDTTYYQERVALGKVMQALGRRNEAEVTAWNFFKQPGREDELVSYTPYEPQHIDEILRELRTDHIDVLVIHAHEDADKLQQEMELARRWMDEGKVHRAGLGMARVDTLRSLSTGHPVSCVLAPYSAFNREAADTFTQAKGMGLTTVAMSPFIRGWKLDEIEGEKAAVADILLRWVTSQDIVDRVIVSMRRPEWVRANLTAVDQGPLTAEEEAQLAEWVERAS